MCETEKTMYCPVCNSKQVFCCSGSGKNPVCYECNMLMLDSGEMVRI